VPTAEKDPGELLAARLPFFSPIKIKLIVCKSFPLFDFPAEGALLPSGTFSHVSESKEILVFGCSLA
jgi:hypothetical protein